MDKMSDRRTYPLRTWLREAALAISAAFVLGCTQAQQPDHNTPKAPAKTSQSQTMADRSKNPVYSRSDTNPVQLEDAEWKKILSPEVYYIARQKGTERPWSSPYETSKAVGTFYCAACGNKLFLSDAKFESGCGWPSFYQPVSKGSVIYEPDHSLGMKRTEVLCGRCRAHLGHVFDDGPPPTGLRYCINGVVLDFEEKAKATPGQPDEATAPSR